MALWIAGTHGGDPAIEKQPVRHEETMVKVYLSELSEIDATVVHGNFGKGGVMNLDGGNHPITVADRVYARGLATHPPDRGKAYVKYRLDRNAKSFHTLVGLNDLPDARRAFSPLAFRVIGDGKVLWSSMPLQALRITQECRVDVENVKMLELQVECTGSCGYARAVWLDPHVLTATADAAKTLRDAPAFP
jgi:hypothetical protein